jgi:hypothetical protein
MQREMERVLDRVKPKIVVMQGAAYGSRAGAVALMKERGIVVVEPQHGWIGPSHGAYNFGRSMATPELFKHMPDYLLTFGEFWSNQVRFPSPAIAIGKPELWDAAQRLRTAGPGRQVLVVSSVQRPLETARLVLSILDALPRNWRVVLRPHPSERATVRDRYPTLTQVDRVTFDQNINAYDSLSESKVVIGVASTVLFEALALGCQVIVVSSPVTDLYLPEGMFGKPVASVDCAAAVMAHIHNEVATPRAQPKYRIEEFWKPNPVENFKQFIAPLLKTAG